MMKELELYLHIPFCVKKCNYCDFLSAPAGEETRAAYVDTLLEEIRGFDEPEDYEVVTVFFGGGTPSILPGQAILRIMEALREKFSFRKGAEITLEANPGTVDKEKLSFYKKAGINRLSFGLQSADAEELKKLGRIHTWEKFLESFQLAREAGFSNINVDLMSALPGQTKESWEKTLRQVLALQPEHISAYSLIIEEGTPFYQLYEKDVERRDAGEEPELIPSEEEERAMYEATGRILKEQGYLHYEISNYAKPGRECCHNLGYWQRRDYLGFGLGASTLLNPVRYKNTEDLEAYLGGDFSKKEFFVLTKDNQIEETMFLGLRVLEGVSKEQFREQFSCELRVVYRKELEKLEKEGLLEEEGDFVRLTSRGIDLSNPVLAEFLLS
ncbi:oxygen-independent coproporphyrinogen III oxidase [Blautia sp. OF03-15BH]|uniref:radical SAM family heme chaperone HemW n=1 Tax=Blautia sp. OF03-15BH TaxID=2292287 RepID=UPI000E46ADF9|nr:oxygen-independent coproporphyrinogen III oxidase [Blautia sp. OF03-15BH]